MGEIVIAALAIVCVGTLMLCVTGVLVFLLAFAADTVWGTYDKIQRRRMRG